MGVSVGIHEAREHRLAADVDQLGVVALGLEDLVLGSDGKDLAVLHRHRLGGRGGVIDRNDGTVVIDDVRCLGGYWQGQTNESRKRAHASGCLYWSHWFRGFVGPASAGRFLKDS